MRLLAALVGVVVMAGCGDDPYADADAVCEEQCSGYVIKYAVPMGDGEFGCACEVSKGPGVIEMNCDDTREDGWRIVMRLLPEGYLRNSPGCYIVTIKHDSE